ncbi:MAG: FAD-binding oxidoreductase [Promethearchaeota archaeon]
MTTVKESPAFKNASKEEIYNKLVEIFGKSNISDKQADLYPYSYDMTESKPHMPDFVVIPENKEQLIELVKYCNEKVIPIVPYITGNNVGGLTIPERGGIIVDFGKKMNKILHVNENMMYAILEPGVTFGHLKSYLDKYHPNLRYSYPYAPPYASVVGNALLSGMNNLSCKLGSMADSINGLEVITAEGDVVHVGSCFYGKEEADPDSWWCRYPIPDLMGLFINWQGMTGLVTKCAVQLWPKLPIDETLALTIKNLEDVGEVCREIGRSEVVDDIAIASSEVIKMCCEIPEPKRFPGEPRMFSIAKISAHTKKEFEAKKEIYLDVVNKLIKKGKDVYAVEHFDEFLKILNLRLRCYIDVPSMVLSLVEYSGLTWFGSYAPTHKIEIMSAKVDALFEKYNIPFFLYIKPMKYSHFCIFRPIIRYDKFKDEEKVRALMNEFADALIAEGAIPYKTPTWLTEKMRKIINPGWIKLFEKIKKTMDPNGIFNPGRWNT